MADWTDKTNTDLLAAWDAGADVWTIKHTGGGEEYRQGVQALAMEMLREMEVMTGEGSFSFAVMDAGQPEVRNNLWAAASIRVKFAPAVLAEMNARDADNGQIQAALQLASNFARNGYETALEAAPADRRVQMSKP